MIDEIKRVVARGASDKYEKTVELDGGSVVILPRLSLLYKPHIHLITSKNTAYYKEVRSNTDKGMSDPVERIG